MGNLGDMDEEPHVLRVRGLPWSATASDIINFFGPEVKILGGEDGIHMTLSREGRPSGEAYIEVESEDDVDLGVQKDKEVMGHRYIEVFKARKSEMEWVVKRNGLNVQSSMDDSCVRLRGLPFGCSKEDIAHFFTGLEIVPNGISLCTDMQGRQTGEAYVQFVNKEIAGKALQKHKERIGHRYIEIFRSSLSEIKAAMGPKIRPVMGFGNRPGPYDRGDRFGGPNRYVNMSQRGGRSFKGFSDFDDYYKNTWDLSHPQRMSDSGMGMGGPCEDYLEEPGPGYSNGNGGNFSTGPVGGFCGRDFPGNNRGGYTGMTRGGFSNVSRGGFSGETVGNYPGSVRGGYSTGGRGGYSGVNCAGLMEENHGPYPSSNVAGYSSDKMMGYSNTRFGAGFPEKGFKGARHCVHMRGLPFRATEQDIVEFFKPIEPVMVNILYENNGRATGEADIDFGTHDDAVRAMSRDKARMQHRYIELFLNST